MLKMAFVLCIFFNIITAQITHGFSAELRPSAGETQEAQPEEVQQEVQPIQAHLKARPVEARPVEARPVEARQEAQPDEPGSYNFRDTFVGTTSNLDEQPFKNFYGDDIFSRRFNDLGPYSNIKYPIVITRSMLNNKQIKYLLDDIDESDGQSGHHGMPFNPINGRFNFLMH